MVPKTRLIVFITGFLKPHAFGGLVELAAAITQMLLPGTEVRIYRWHEHDRIVKEIRQFAPDELMIVGHSYGVSTGMFVAWTLRDITVHHFVSTDGIWRPDADRPSFKSLNKYQMLRVPPNIVNLYTFRQERGRLTGHGFMGERINEQWRMDEWPTSHRHGAMDRLPSLFALVKKIAQYDSETFRKTTN